MHLLWLSDAELTGPDEAVCTGNQIVFLCNQPAGISRWTVHLPDNPLMKVARHTDAGRALLFANVPYGFEIYVLPHSSMTLVSSELRVTADGRLDGVMVECGGINGTFSSEIQVASVGECIHSQPRILSI